MLLIRWILHLINYFFVILVILVWSLVLSGLLLKTLKMLIWFIIGVIFLNFLSVRRLFRKHLSFERRLMSSNWNKFSTFVSYHNLMLSLTFVSKALRFPNVHLLLAYIVPNTSFIFKILTIFAYIHTLRNCDRFILSIELFCLILPYLIRLNFLNFNLLYWRFLVKFVSESFGVLCGIFDRNWQFLVYFWITVLLWVLWL